MLPIPDLNICSLNNSARNPTKVPAEAVMYCIHHYSVLNVKRVRIFASIQTGVASIGTLMSLILLFKAVRLRKNNSFFILLFTLIFMGLACTIVLVWTVMEGTNMLSSSNYWNPYFKDGEYYKPLFASLIVLTVADASFNTA